MSPESIIELNEVDIAHTDVADALLVRDVNWRIAREDFWVVGGRQASGKSSLLLTAAGLNRPAKGTLRILGHDLAEATEQEQVEWRRRIGFVFEFGGRLFSHLTVAQNIALPLSYHRLFDEDQVVAKVEELLDLTELRPHAEEMPSRLSLGLQQRVGLARSLALSPEVLFIDNPLAALATREARWWLELLSRLRETRTADRPPITIVASSDDFRGWTDAAHQFAVVEAGRWRVIGNRENLAASTEPVVQEFLANEI